MGIAAKGPSGSEILELSDGQSAAVSSVSTVRIRGNAATGQAEVSAFGSAYASMAGGSVQLPGDNTTYSFVNNLYGSAGLNVSMGGSASFTQGVAFAPIQQRVIQGVRFWCNLSAPTDFKAGLWESGGGTLLASETATIPAGDDFYEITFSSPHTILKSDLSKEMRVTLYHTSGTEYPRATSSGSFVPATPFAAGVYIQSNYRWFASGDAYPSLSAGTDYYMIEPIFQKVTA